MMEEYDLISRLKKKTSFKVIHRDVIVSPRDYVQHGEAKLQSKYAVLLINVLCRVLTGKHCKDVQEAFSKY